MLGSDADAGGARSGARVTELLLRHGEWDVVDPGSASWRFLSFRVERLRDGEQVSRHTGGDEVALVPLGGRCAVESGGERWELGERPSVFDGLPWALYLPRDTDYTLSALGDVEVVNGLGAGDAFIATLVQSLHAGLPMDEAVRRGSVAGAIVASQLACSEAMPTLAELQMELA